MDNDNIPEPIQLKTFIINRNKEKFCDCYNWINKMKGIRPQFEFDTTNRIVTCVHCGIFIDAFDALLVIAKDYEEMEREEKQLCRIAKEAAEYKPWRRAMKNIEQSVGRSGQMLPHCPQCGNAFRLEQIQGYTNQDCVKNKGWAIESEDK